MSNIEHLIENAITCLEGNKDFDYFTTMWQNKGMLKYVNASPEEIWEMAIYVVTTYKDGIVWDTEDKIEKKYGYPIPEE